MKKTAFWAAGVAALALATQPALAADTIKIGFVSTFSGPTAAIGNDMRNSSSRARSSWPQDGRQADEQVGLDDEHRAWP